MSNNSTHELPLRQQLSSIIKTIPFGVLTISDELEVSIINGQAVQLLGFDKKEISNLIDVPYQNVLKNRPEILDQFETRIISRKKRSFDLHDIVCGEFELNVKCRKMLHGTLIIIEDITSANAILHRATHDNLTQLVNRQHFEERTEKALIKARKHNLDGALIYIDLDRFKPVNDTAGHAAGDELLKRVSTIMKSRVRDRDTVSRVGGDEFAILLEDCPIVAAEFIAENIRKDIEKMAFSYDGHIFNISISAGIAQINKSFTDLNTLVKAADTACQYSKNEGRNHVHVICQKTGEFAAHVEEVAWFEEINKALANDSFVLYAQKIVPISPKSGEAHYEILLRLQNDDGKIIPPSAFMSSAERYDMMPMIDHWVLREAFKQFNANDCYSINLSGQSLSDDSLGHYIEALREKYNIDATKITFEITETSAIQKVDKTMALIDFLKNKGFKFSLDDFGTGLSSYSYLRNMPVDYLKIDGQFIKEIETDDISFAMIKSINDVGHSMGLKTVAEFVENGVILNKLKEIGIDYAQGYHLHKPQPLAEIINEVAVTPLRLRAVS